MIQKIVCTLFIIGVFIQAGYAQISNVSHKKNGNSFQITYDLIGRGDTSFYDVQVIALINGIEFTPSTKALEGAFGNVQQVGRNKEVVWNYLLEDNIVINDRITIDFVLKAKPTPPTAAPKIRTDLYLGGGSTTLGGAFLALGISKFFSANNKKYDTECNPASETRNENSFNINPVTKTSPCDDLYNLANSDRKNGVIFASIGVAAIVSGVYILLKKPFEKKYTRKKALEIEVSPSFSSIPHLSNSTMNLTLRYRL